MEKLRRNKLMKHDLVIEGNFYINNEFQRCCVGINDGKFTEIKKILTADKIFKFSKKIILPAGIDVHVHFRDPGFTHKEDFRTGSKSTVFGGISCVFDMPNTLPQTITVDTVKDKIQNANNKSYTDFGVYAGITNTNIRNILDLERIADGFKIYLGSSTNSLLLKTDNLKQVFDVLNDSKKPILFHAEDENCLKNHSSKEETLIDHKRNRPAECEVKAIKDILSYHDNSNSKVHICHVSTRQGMEILKNIKENITFGVTPHHALLNIDKDINPSSYFKVNPPIGPKEHNDAIINAINNGLIDILESDHAPHTDEEKNQNFNNAPSGIPGVETMYPLFLYLATKGIISFPRLIKMICENPAKLTNILKGFIKKDFDADLIVVDLKNEQKISPENLHSKADWTPFKNMKAVFPSNVFIRGNMIVDESQIIEKAGYGKHI
jgi:dihydroorotase